MRIIGNINREVRGEIISLVKPIFKKWYFPNYCQLKTRFCLETAETVSPVEKHPS